MYSENKIKERFIIEVAVHENGHLALSVHNIDLTPPAEIINYLGNTFYSGISIDQLDELISYLTSIIESKIK